MTYIIIAAAIVAVYFVAIFVGADKLLNYAVLRKGVEKASAKQLASDAPPTPYRLQSVENHHLWEEQPKQELRLVSFDGAELVGYRFDAAEPCKRVAFVMHGHDCTPDSLFASASLFLKAGYNLFMPEMRGNGRSGGKAITFGVLESRDALLWLQKVIEIYGDDCRIVIMGNSLGAATTLLTAAKKELPPQVKCVIEDCAYSSATELFYRRGFDKLTRPVGASVLWAADVLSRRLAGFSLNAASPVAAVPHIELPALFIHGGSDGFVPADMCETLYLAKTGLKEKLIVENAGHGVSYNTAPELYTEACLKFADRYLK